MILRQSFLILIALPLAVACSQTGGEAQSDAADSVPGLTKKTLRKGYGRVAVDGDFVEVHYTGWLYDENAVDSRGQKFDSSVDRNERFQFMLGAGQVIKGWDQGIVGMLIGEVRELKIAPEMAYGERDLGVIPPGSTLIFEVQLFAVEGPESSTPDSP
jgi:FKBP-type peptidyl-prolyl cis-trans isomerase FkpA